VDAVLAKALAAEQHDHVGEALAALELLARLLTPEVFDEDDESPPFAGRTGPSPHPNS
jgi:hypothetical protein